MYAGTRTTGTVIGFASVNRLASHRQEVDHGNRMIRLADHPYMMFAAFLAVQWGAAYLGDLLRRKVMNTTGEKNGPISTSF